MYINREWRDKAARPETACFGSGFFNKIGRSEETEDS
jgi:hypothetical protein